MPPRTKQLTLLVILSLIALWPFAKSGYFESHDGEWMVIRFTAFHQTLRSGQFPVRFVDRLNNNYGYPVLNFLYPLPFYLAEIPKLLGFGFVDSIKIIFVVTTVSSALAMFWALSGIFVPIASFVGALVYLYVPYRFVDLYVRGSFGESVAFVFLPLIFGSIYKIILGKPKFKVLLAISSAALILSHNVIAAIFLPFAILAAVILAKNDLSKLKDIAFQILLGASASVFFWFPAIYDLKYVKLSQIKVSEIQNHLVGINKLILPIWGYGPNPVGINPLPVQLGIITIGIFISILAIYLYQKKKDKILTFMLVIFASITFLMTKPSQVIWTSIPAVDIIQFPWRLLSLSLFIAAFLAAYLVQVSKKKTVLVILLTVAAIFSTISYTRPANFINKGDSYYSTNEDTTTVRDEYLPIWIKSKPEARSNQKIEIIEGQANIVDQTIKSANYQAKIIANSETKMRVNTIYFPGWQIKVNNRSAPINYQNDYGLIEFQLPKGEHEVIIKYAKTPVHLASEILSVAALFLIGLIFYFSWRKQNS